MEKRAEQFGRPSGGLTSSTQNAIAGQTGDGFIATT
jgi:hypothetical protein